MYNILVCNQKGGVGKSLIADELAFSFERSGIPLNFYDLDSQGGTIHRSQKSDDAQVGIVDTPGALQPALKDWIGAADLIIIPTRTTSRDIAPMWRMKEAVEKAGKLDKAMFVLNGWNRYRASSDFLSWIRGTCGSDAKVFRLPQSEKFVQAGAAGTSVVAHAKGGPAVAATLELCNAVRELGGFPSETVA